MDEMRISITVPGKPIPKARPFVRKDGRVFTRKETALFEQAVRLHAMAAMKGRKILTGAVRLTVTAFFGIPKSWNQTQKAKAMSGALRHTKKPDISNCQKSVEDAMNGIVYADDSQIIESIGKKVYSNIPRTEIIVETLDNEF